MMLYSRCNIVLRNDPKSILYFNYKYIGDAKIKGRLTRHFTDQRGENPVYVFADGKYKTNIDGNYVGTVRDPIFVRVKSF